MLTIDGAFGEGGGQIVRSSLCLAAITGRPVTIFNIRANRKNPGLAAQHLTAVRAAAMICDADLRGDELGSSILTFAPQAAAIPGDYLFDVAEAREGGSAGATSLVLQTVLLPLELAAGPSRVTVLGGTHVAWSPPFHYLRDVFLPALARLGVRAGFELAAWGWYPAGQGEVTLSLPGGDSLSAANWPKSLRRGKLQRITGVAVAANLPAHIAQRIRNRAANLLDAAGLPHQLEPLRVRSVSPGAGIFLAAEYEHSRAGFSALGAKGKPSEVVAQEAVDALLAFQRSGAAVDAHLADQLLLPLALAGAQTTLAIERVSEHTRTNLAVVEQFLGPVARISGNRLEFMAGRGVGSKQ